VAPEIIKADRRFRNTVLLVYAALLLLGIVAWRWLIPMGLRHLSSLGWHDWMITIRAVFSVILVVPAPAAVYCIMVGLKTLESGQYPHPGRRVMRDTAVVRGPSARRRGRALVALGVVFLVFMVVVLVYNWVRYTMWLNDPLFRKYLFHDSAVVWVAPGGAAGGSAAGSGGILESGLVSHSLPVHRAAVLCPSTSSTALPATPSSASSRAA